ncbi:Proteinase K-like catalytic domain [Candidatus Nanopelagicaceae bacterium]
MLRNRFTSKLISLLLTALFFTGMQSVGAVDVKEIDISTADSCSVSLASVWSAYGVPHPCFANGSALKIKTPAQSKIATSYYVQINGSTRTIVSSEYVSIPTYKTGLNEVVFEKAGTTSGSWVEVSSTKFIVYTPVTNLRLRVATVSKSPYVVSLNSGFTIAEFVASVGAAKNEYLIKTLVNSKGLAVQETLVVDLSADQIVVAAGSAMVANIVKEGVISTAATQTGATWGLDRIDQFTKTGDGNYNYSYDGSGVDIYVIDSGIRLDHSEFTGRITDAYYLTSLGTVEDCTGHGTHVAAIAAGTTYGVAKMANLIPVRIMNCLGEGTLSGLLSAVTLINSIHISTTPAVANLSLGFGYNTTMNSYVQALINDGIVTVVAAGNDGADACNYSPASAPNVITVGATTSIDQDATFSNIGSCVDIFAPGVSILSAGISSSSSTATMSGTSMASPFVAGAAALVLQKNFSGYSNKLDANALVRDSLVNNATPEALTDSSGYGSWWSGTVNKLLYLPFLSLSTQSTLQISNASLNLAIGAATNLTTSGGTGSGAVTYRTYGIGCQISGSTLTVTVKRSCSVTAIKAPDQTYTFTQSAWVTFAAGQDQAARVPEISESSIKPTLDGFTLEITNYDSTFTWTAVESAPSATVVISSAGVVTVTGLGTGVTSTVTITASKIGYTDGVTTSRSITTLLNGLVPAFDTSTVISTVDGFEITLSNYSSSYQWSAASAISTAAATVSNAGVVKVTSVSPGTASTVTVTSQRNGYSRAISTSLSYSSITGAALIPTFDTSTAISTADGFQLNVGNHNPDYTWTGTTSVVGGSVAVSNVGRITVTGIPPDTSSTVRITASRAGYYSGTETSTALTSLKAGKIATYDTTTATLDGFTIAISNFDNVYGWSAASSHSGASAVIDTDGLVTVTGVTTGTPSTVTVTTTRTGYANTPSISPSVTSLPSAVATLRVFTINSSNVLPAGSQINISTDTSTVTVVATPTSQFATIVITGNTGLIVGANTVRVFVRSQDLNHYETYTATVNYSRPQPPAPEPSGGGGGGGGGGGAPKQTALYFQVVDPTDPTKIYTKSVCVEIYSRTLFPQFMGTGCSGTDGRINVLVGDAKVSIRVFELGNGANYKEYLGEVANDTFTLDGGTFFAGTTRFVISLTGPKSEPVVTPTPTPVATPTPTPSPSPTPVATPTPTPTPSPSASPIPAPTVSPQPNPTFTTNVPKSSYFATTTSTKNLTKVTLKNSTAAVSTKVGKSLQITISTVGTKSVVVKLSIKDPSGKSYTVASVSIAKNKAYLAPIVKFSKPGTYVFAIYIGTVKKVVTVKVTS